MSKVFALVALMLTLMTVPAAALSRVTVTRTIEHPKLLAVVAVFPIVFMAIENNLCTFVAGSVAPDWPPERQKLALGDCPPRATPR